MFETFFCIVIPPISPRRPKTTNSKKRRQSRPNGCTNAAATGASSREVAAFYLPVKLEGMPVAESVPETPKKNNINDTEKRGVIDELLKESNKGFCARATSAEFQSILL